ncbi:MAG: pyroglutamyl-peptidase I [Clostridia bacterium]|nr:pyroglutamyl-peptidase I [Clostridia bacterium]
MKTLLITGFEPFGGETINPSWDAVCRLPDTVGEYSLIKLLIPVTFGEAAQKVIALANDVHPDVVLCIGQAGGRAAITPELVGINLRHAPIPDNGGNQPQDEQIVSGGENAYFSTLPIRKIAAAILNLGVPSQVSYSAGAYVCNDVFYSLLAHFQRSKTRVGFIHVPYCTEQNKTPCLPLNDIVKGLTVAIETLS